MKVVMFSDTWYPWLSGVVTCVDTLRKALEAEGHTVYLVTINLDSNKTEYDKETRTLKLPSLINLEKVGTSFVYPYSIKTTNLIRKWKPDLIHTHTELGLGAYGRIIGKQFGIPVVHTYHTFYEDYSYYLTHGYFEKTTKFVLGELTTLFCDKTITELTVTSDKIKNIFMEHYDISKQIHVVPNGLKIERFYDKEIKKEVLDGYKKEFGIKQGDFILGYLGRVAKEKNVRFLVNAMKDIVKLGNNIKLMICGSGNDIDDLKKLCDKLKINDRVIFTGKYPYEYAPYYFHLCDIFVMASTSETQGVTLIEAMASSKPAICIKDPSYDGALEDGYNGYYFTNEKEYINKVKELYNNPDKLKEFSSNARMSVEKHSEKTFAKNMLKVYELAIEKNKKYNFGLISKLVDKVKDRK